MSGSGAAGQPQTRQEAVAALKSGRVVVFPTDTVYGLGVAIRYASSPAEVCALKRRDASKPIAWLVGGVEDLRRYGRGVSPQALALAQAHWPGALTIIVEASDAVPAAFAPNGTIGLRMPANECALSLIREVGPLAASSANRSGKPAPRSFGEVASELVDEVACALFEGDLASGVASTVVDATGEELHILRQGDIVL